MGVLLEVVFSVLDVIAPEDLGVSVVLILFVVEKVDSFQQSLLMVLQLSHPCTNTGCSRIEGSAKKKVFTIASGQPSVPVLRNSGVSTDLLSPSSTQQTKDAPPKCRPSQHEAPWQGIHPCTQHIPPSRRNPDKTPQCHRSKHRTRCPPVLPIRSCSSPPPLPLTFH